MTFYWNKKLQGKLQQRTIKTINLGGHDTGVINCVDEFSLWGVAIGPCFIGIIEVTSGLKLP